MSNFPDKNNKFKAKRFVKFDCKKIQFHKYYNFPEVFLHPFHKQFTINQTQNISQIN